MTFATKHNAPRPPGTGEHAPFITVTQSGFGHCFAVMMWWNPDLGGFWEPYDTARARRDHKFEAVIDAKEWAAAEGLEYRP